MINLSSLSDQIHKPILFYKNSISPTTSDNNECKMVFHYLK